MRQTNRFTRGSGRFACGICKRQTRNTGDNGSVELCPECYEICGLDNEISDYGDPDGKLQKQIDALKAEVVAKGGKLSK